MELMCQEKISLEKPNMKSIFYSSLFNLTMIMKDIHDKLQYGCNLLILCMCNTYILYMYITMITLHVKITCTLLTVHHSE